MKKITLILLTLLLLGIGAYGQEGQYDPNKEATRIANIENKLESLIVDIPQLGEKLNVKISNTSLTNFLRAVAQLHQINLNVANELNSINFINNFNDVTIKELLVFLAKEHQLALETTGNIISIKRYTPPTPDPVEKDIQVEYDLTAELLSTDLRNDPLPKVFRKITETSGKNLLFSPELSNKSLTLFISKVPFDIAMKKLAEANNLDYTKTRDGFYEFSSFPGMTEGTANTRIRRNRSDFYYKVIDTINRVITVDFKNTQISEVIENLTEDLDLDVFTASPLENAGTVTVKAEAISFDDLLIKMFESNSTASSPTNSPQNSRNTTQPGVPTSAVSNAFTFKKENNVYYFGTEDQLTVKKIELVQMMHRSIAMLGDANPSTSYGNSFGGQNFNSGGTNFFGNGPTNGINQTSGLTNSRNTTNTNSRFTQNTRSSNTADTSVGSISDIFPADVIAGLDIKIDTELNSFVVSGPGARVEKFKKFISYIDKPVPLILIEVMILEVNRTATLETGVEFGIGSEPSKTEGVSFPDSNIRLGAETVNRIIGGFDGFGSLNIGNVVPNFYLDIKAMEANGNVKILSTPKLSTLNGHKAYLSSGQTTYYEVVSQNIFGSQNPQTSEIVNYQPIDAELALEFKPFVAGDGQITLDIQVIQSNFSGERIAEGAPPDINSRRFSSIMRMQANDVAILGGIEQKIKNDSGSGVPFLARIPIIKWFFSKRVREDTKRRLNVIIKPTVFY
ncbi:type II secretion system protein GspD [Aquimarina brevivitae]|nr:type II and III secretion system protein [Aquimarina brevivitae]